MATNEIKTTTTHTLIECPACEKPIVARVLLTGSLDTGRLIEGSVKFTISGDVTGLQVDHDCMPKLTR